MKKKPRFLNMSALVLCLCAFANAQQTESKTRKTLRLNGKVTLVLLKATARATFEAAKFTGSHVIVPVVKNVGVPAVKATPPLIGKAAKLAAKGIRNGVKSLSSDHDGDKPADQNSNGSTN